MGKYQEADDPDEQLRRFRATHLYKQYNVAGAHWEYILCGYGQEPLLLLPGVHGLGEVAFQLILRFEQGYRIIAPSYPSDVATIARLVDGLASILTVENLSQVNVVGGSFSGMIAQQLVRRHPNRVKKLVLDHAGVPRRDRTKKYRFYGKILSFLPLALIHIPLKLGKSISLLGMPNRRAFWNTYFDEIIAALRKEDYLSRIQICIDFDQNYTFARDDLLSWSGSMLIIEADNDAYVSLKEREALKVLYPKAQVHTFHGTSHFAWATELEVFLHVIEHFLQER